MSSALLKPGSPIGTLVALAVQLVTHQGAQCGVWMFLLFHQPPWNESQATGTSASFTK
jgi:hypothetical protein